MAICIFGERSDLMPVYVAWLAQKRSIDVLWLSESTLGQAWSFSFDDQRAGLGFVEVENRRYCLEAIQGAYVNLNPCPELPWQLDCPPQELNFILNTRRNSIQALIDSLPCLVANRTYAGRSNNSKPYQMALLAQAGFEVPTWIVSNEAGELADFTERFDGNVIAKSCSGLRSRVKRVDEILLNKLAAGTTPVIAQQLIGGRDVRVHTVGGRAFATEICSNQIDYRFDEGAKEYRPAILPPALEAMCHQFAAEEQMVLAGFDFKVTADDRWYCLEMNPVPTFLPYEMESGQPIGDALLDQFSSLG